jgi:hypothetical protein
MLAKGFTTSELAMQLRQKRPCPNSGNLRVVGKFAFCSALCKGGLSLKREVAMSRRPEWAVDLWCLRLPVLRWENGFEPDQFPANLVLSVIATRKTTDRYLYMAKARKNSASHMRRGL